ncbi:MAG: hypothetical protein MZV70_18800 [Desulfobacterales bacterium]|nr:hypothetical protein [Desulfobacterales bacterium]
MLAEDRLFATLDPSSRRLRFPRDIEVIITDTVGFIRDLPQRPDGGLPGDARGAGGRRPAAARDRYQPPALRGPDPGGGSASWRICSSTRKAMPQGLQQARPRWRPSVAEALCRRHAAVAVAARGHGHPRPAHRTHAVHDRRPPALADVGRHRPDCRAPVGCSPAPDARNRHHKRLRLTRFVKPI